MKKLILIGAIRKGKEPNCGETMKNQLFVKRFEEVFDKVIQVDTHHWQKRPWCLITALLSLLFNKGAKVVISSCDISAYRLIKFLYYVRLKKDVFYWVVGGGFHELVKSGVINPKYYHYLKGIFVQSQDMVDELKNYGLTNARYIPNSKPVYQFPIGNRNGDVMRFVFLSRIHEEKGCREIIECAKKMNDEGLRDKYSITFYGNIESKYENEFLNNITNIDNIAYKGLLNLTTQTGYEELSKNDVFLFPTYYFNEGFPGVVIDAYIAGLPIIATNWHFNNQVVEDGVTGILIEPKNANALYETMMSFIQKKNDYNGMQKSCLQKANQYDVHAVLSDWLLKEIGLLN
jgi:glycosyltransferase involved in cell wall biosynthesis